MTSCIPTTGGIRQPSNGQNHKRINIPKLEIHNDKQHGLLRPRRCNIRRK